MTKTRVLVVEDSLTVRRHLCDVLASAPDIEVVGEADDGTRALELCAALRPDVITMDMMLPVMTGLDCARAIRALECRLGRGTALPLVAVSANVAPADREAALAAGMDDCLPKPLERAALLRWLERLSSSSAGSRMA